jgi:hypothetical protein
MKDRWDSLIGYSCKTCRFYVPKTKDIGRCRRNAPTMDGFPVVYPDVDFCGNHKIGTNPFKEADND